MRAPASLLVLIAASACSGEAEPAAPANGSPIDQAVSASATTPPPSVEPPPSPVAPMIPTLAPPPALTAAELAMAGGAPPPPSPEPTPAPGWDAARAASMRGDHQEVVRQLEGSARSAREHALLIEAYRALNNTRAMCRNLAVFVSRYSTAPQSNSYRQTLARQCGDEPRWPTPQPAPSVDAPVPTDGASNWDEARAAALRGDNQGVVRALEGRSRSPRELTLLIEAYRQLGNMRAACRNMDLFMSRYATAPQTNNYRMTIARQCAH